MKKTMFILALSTASVAFGARTDATTMDQETASSYKMFHDPNTNDRFNNRDTRTNSMSTPAHTGAENSEVPPDVTSNQFREPSRENRMTGSSTDSNVENKNQAGSDWQNRTTPEGSDASVYRTDESHLSGSGTEMSGDEGESMATESAEQSAGEAAATTGGEMAGQKAATETHQTRKTTKAKAKKAKSKRHSKSKKSGSSSDESGLNDSSMTPSNERSGSSSSNIGPAAGAAAAGSTMGASAAESKDLTAQDTARTRAEADLVQKIRSEITANKNLSTNAHNVKIISKDGQIFLKGPVADANEKMKIGEIAKQVAGNTNVINQTTIEARSGSSSNK